MKHCIASLIIALCAGCTSTKYVSEDGATFTRFSIGNRQQLSELELSVSDNKRTMRMKGYKSDQVELLEKGIELGKAAAGMKP